MRVTTTRRAAVLLMLFALLFVGKANANNAQEARKMFDRTWKMVFGPEGCSLNYSVNIIGIYKTQGSIAIKGKKQHFVEKRYCAWNNGKKLYSVDLKKKKWNCTIRSHQKEINMLLSLRTHSTTTTIPGQKARKESSSH